MNSPELHLNAPKEKVFVKTFGCQMNVSDSERMNALLAEGGMEPTDNADDASVILINGCSVREKAVHKSVSFLGRLKKDLNVANNNSATEKKKPIIAVGGCVGQLNKDSLFKQAPYLDFVFGPDTIDQLPEMIYRAKQGEKKKLYADFDPTMGYTTKTKIYGQKTMAFVNIMKGCDKYCTYCIVPYTRGREKSRTIDEVCDDLASLVNEGMREVTLLGQNVNSFGKGNENTKQRLPLELANPIGKVGPRAGEENFPQLLRAIDTDPRLSAIKRVRFTSSHPLDFSDELIECYARAENGGIAKLAPQLHLPVQSGSNAVLAKMGRHHKIEHYIAQMNRLKELNPDIGLSTDLIVGFPTETEEDFELTLKLLDQVQYDTIYAFAYSPRPGTRANKMKDDVPNDVKNERLNRLLAHQLLISEKRFVSRIGKTMEILVESESKNNHLLESEAVRSIHEKVWMGRTGCGRVVNFASRAARDLKGQFLNVKIIRASGLSLIGEFDDLAASREIPANS